MTKSKVIRNSFSTVLPAHSIPAFTHFLSNLDQLFAPSQLYMETVYCFRGKQSSQPLPCVQSLKASLSQVLSLYPVFAGRLKKSDTEAGRFEVEVNGEGVPFEEAEAEASLDDWSDLCECELIEELLPQNPYVVDLFNAPLIRLQFTKFQCGGIVLGLSQLHVVADGLAAIEFMKTWGEIHRGMQASFPPLFESKKIRARIPPSVSIPSADEVLLACAPILHPAVNLLPSKRFKNVHFRMEREDLQKCREDVQNGPFSYGAASTFEAISGLLWTLVTRARNLEETDSTTYVFPVSLREKWHPPLPAVFVGNAVFMNHASAMAKEIRSNHFSFAASLIRKKVKIVDSTEFVQSIVDWIEVRLQEQKPIGVGFDASAGTNVINTSFNHFPVYDIDFAQKVDHFDIIIRREFVADGMMYILPSPPSCGGKHCRDIKLRLREDHLETMLRDPDFQLYFPKYSAKYLHNKP